MLRLYVVAQFWRDWSVLTTLNYVHKLHTIAPPLLWLKINVSSCVVCRYAGTLPSTRLSRTCVVESLYKIAITTTTYCIQYILNCRATTFHLIIAATRRSLLANCILVVYLWLVNRSMSEHSWCTFDFSLHSASNTLKWFSVLCVVHYFIVR